MTKELIVVTVFLIGVWVLTPLQAASILDVFDWDLSESLNLKEAELRSEGEQSARNCICNGPSCICCIDFNITYVDLGGPGCVHMKYLSQEEGFAVNVSYGNKPLHSSVIKGPNPEPICMNIFARIAQMCARFVELSPTAEGLRGCLQVEPRLFGNTQAEFPLGCFRSSEHGMEMEEIPADTEEEEGDEEDDDDDGKDEEEPESEKQPPITAQALIQAVNDSAEQGIKFFSSLLGLVENQTNNSTEAPQESKTIDRPKESSTVSETQTAGRSLSDARKHPNLLR